MAKTNKTLETTYSKEQLVKAKRFIKHIDLLNALLKEGVQYTIADVESIINKFLTKKVR